MPEISLTRVVDKCASTNTLLKELPDAPHGLLIAARHQTAGRGQRGNSWEAEPRANLTFSILFRTGMEARRQFELSMVVSLALVEFINTLIFPVEAEIKWPNDIYVGDRKICGILIEHSLAGKKLDRSVVGAGINLNQEHFLSDAPNPVSVLQLTGRRTDVEMAIRRVGDILRAAVDSYIGRPDPEALHDRYMAILWRREGTYPFRTPDGQEFPAGIEDVAADGTLCLTNRQRYAFKEIIFVI